MLIFDDFLYARRKIEVVSLFQKTEVLTYHVNLVTFFKQEGACLSQVVSATV